MWKTRERTFAFSGEQAFCRELLFKLLELDLQRADALQLHRAHEQLILSARFVHRDFALQQNFLPILHQLAMRHRFVTKQHTTQLRARIFECEINVPGAALQTEVGDLTADPNRADLFFEKTFDLRGEFADRKNLASLFCWEQFAEVPLGFGGLAHRFNISWSDGCD